MMEAGDYPAGSAGGRYAWSTSKAKRRAQGKPARQYANFQSQPRPGEREPIDREARGKSLNSSLRPGQMPPGQMIHDNARAAGARPAPNMGKHAAASIHTAVGQGDQRAALRGAPRTVNVQAGRNTNRGGNRVTYNPSGRRR